MSASFSKTQGKGQRRHPKKDASPFLDAALEFLFAIVEQDIQKKEPAYIAPSIHEFYTLSLRSTHSKVDSDCYRNRYRNRNRNSNRNHPLPTVSHPLFHLLRHTLGSHATVRTHNQIFRTCFFTVVTALLGYSAYLQCMDPVFPTSDLIHSALAWYFSHYFLPTQRDVFLAMVRHQIFEKRSAILNTYFPCKPSLACIPTCLRSMQNYFASSEIQQDILPMLLRLL